jgi:hypothetical protein
MKTVGMTVQLEQDGDCVGGEDYQYLDIQITDGGGGPFFVLKTERWAFDYEDLDRLSSKLNELMTMYKKESPTKKESL